MVCWTEFLLLQIGLIECEASGRGRGRGREEEEEEEEEEGEDEEVYILSTRGLGGYVIPRTRTDRIEGLDDACYDSLFRAFMYKYTPYVGLKNNKSEYTPPTRTLSKRESPYVP